MLLILDYNKETAAHPIASSCSLYSYELRGGMMRPLPFSFFFAKNEKGTPFKLILPDA
jgi:peptidoglycan biosynthesis protein MviN/MurJ (putative lipid II flippase)